MGLNVTDVVLARLNAAIRALVELDLIDDGEFQTVVGFTRTEVTAYLPLTSPLSDDELAVAVSGLNNLLGYPHTKDEMVERATGIPMSDLEAILVDLVARR